MKYGAKEPGKYKRLSEQKQPSAREAIRETTDKYLGGLSDHFNRGMSKLTARAAGGDEQKAQEGQAEGEMIPRIQLTRRYALSFGLKSKQRPWADFEQAAGVGLRGTAPSTPLQTHTSTPFTMPNISYTSRIRSVIPADFVSELALILHPVLHHGNLQRATPRGQ